MKDKRVELRVTKKDFDLIDHNSKRNGFDNKTEYLLYLVNNDKFGGKISIDIDIISKLNTTISQLSNFVEMLSEQNNALLIKIEKSNLIAELLYIETYVTKKNSALNLAHFKSFFSKELIELTETSIDETVIFMEKKEKEIKNILANS